jgi:hypothetical protein
VTARWLIGEVDAVKFRLNPIVRCFHGGMT